MAHIQKIINGLKTGVLKCRSLHMCCVAHIINLVVSNGMKHVDNCVVRIRQAVRFIK